MLKIGQKTFLVINGQFLQMLHNTKITLAIQPFPQWHKKNIFQGEQRHFSWFYMAWLFFLVVIPILVLVAPNKFQLFVVWKKWNGVFCSFECPSHTISPFHFKTFSFLSNFPFFFPSCSFFYFLLFSWFANISRCHVPEGHSSLFPHPVTPVLFPLTG